MGRCSLTGSCWVLARCLLHIRLNNNGVFFTHLTCPCPLFLFFFSRCFYLNWELTEDILDLSFFFWVGGGGGGSNWYYSEALTIKDFLITHLIASFPQLLLGMALSWSFCVGLDHLLLEGIHPLQICNMETLCTHIDTATSKASQEVIRNGFTIRNHMLLCT